MLDLLEAPPAKRPLPPGMTPFTSATASAAARRKHQLEREAKAALLLPKPPAPAQTNAEQAVCEQLTLIADQIARTRDVLNDDHAEWCEECERGGIQPHHRAQLLKALDTLLDRQRKLLRIADPAPIKASSREPRGQTLAAWQPVPAPAQAVGQDAGITAPFNQQVAK